MGSLCSKSSSLKGGHRLVSEDPGAQPAAAAHERPDPRAAAAQAAEQRLKEVSQSPIPMQTNKVCQESSVLTLLEPTKRSCRLQPQQRTPRFAGGGEQIDRSSTGRARAGTTRGKCMPSVSTLSYPWLTGCRHSGIRPNSRKYFISNTYLGPSHSCERIIGSYQACCNISIRRQACCCLCIRKSVCSLR